MVLSKRSYRHGEFKNVLPLTVHILYFPAQSRTLARVMGGSIGSMEEICEISRLPNTMVPRFHQCNGYIKRKLPAWRVQKYNALVGGDTVLTSWGSQTTPSHGWQYNVQRGNLRNFGPIKPHGTAFAPMQWLYQKEATGIESSKMYCPSRYRNRTY